MEDFIGVIVLIIIGIISSSNKKKKKALKKSAPKQPVIPYAQPSAVPNPTQPVVDHDTLRKLKEEQFQKEMQAIRENVREQFAEKKAAEGKAAVQTSPQRRVAPTVHTSVKVNAAPKAQTTEGVDPCHDGFYEGDEPPQSEYLPDQPALLEAMEGVDPCHDALYAEEADTYESDEARTDNRAAQELLRGVILSEVLTRPANRWRTQRR